MQAGKNTTIIYFVRHGETQWNVENRMQGQKDSSLTAAGRKQAAQLANHLQAVPIDVIYEPEYGETLAQLQTRSMAAVKRIAQKQAQKSVLLVSHGITLRTILLSLRHEAIGKIWELPALAPTSFSVVEISDGIALVKRCGSTQHLIAPSA